MCRNRPDWPYRKPETLAPLTDAGLTPYRGMKKLRAAGKLGADRIVVVNGIGGLGSYAVQYARLLGGGATVLAFARSDEKLLCGKGKRCSPHRHYPRQDSAGRAERTRGPDRPPWFGGRGGRSQLARTLGYAARTALSSVSLVEGES
jgi:hypothetical protein